MVHTENKASIIDILKKGWSFFSGVVAKLFRLLPQSVQIFLRHHKWKSIITFVVLFLLVLGYRAIVAEPEPEIITATVTRGDLIQVVEAVGKLTSERDLNLQFPISGVVAEVLVKEGDTVKAGDRLASLRANDLSANVQSALANVQATQADLQEMREGARPEDIAIAEAEVQNKRASLKAAQDKLASSEQKLTKLEREAEVALSGYITTTRSTVSQRMTTTNTALSVIQGVLSENDVRAALTLESFTRTQLLENQIKQAKKNVEEILNKDQPLQNFQQAMVLLQEARVVISNSEDTLSSLYAHLSGVQTTVNFTKSERETHRASINSERENIQASLNAIDSQLKSLQDASAGYDTLIAAEQTLIITAKGDILTLWTSLRTQEAQLALKRAGSRQTDIDAAAARMRQAQAELARTRSAFSDTILYAPTDGFITKVNIKTGELLSTSFQQDAAITMLGESPYRIELYASEVDIPKVQLQQDAAVELDAFPAQQFPMIVAEIDPAATDVDGVPKYRIKLDFMKTDPGFKIGMTGDVDIFTGKRENVLMVPARAVIENDEGEDMIRILDDGEVIERVVEIGMEGENDIEVMVGVEEGEEVVVLIKK